MNTYTIGLAMSGGVDSTVAATLLQAQGHRVQGFFMRLPLPGLEAQQKRVQDVADRLHIPLHCIDLCQQFRSEIIDRFIATYQVGQTPNPCIHCNHAIKFGLLADTMRQAGMERVATGHYARIEQQEGHFFISRAADPSKDQSYFLARLGSAHLHDVLFPLTDWNKAAVREHANALGFCFEGEESQDVCFLPDGLPAFLAAQGVRELVGPVVTLNGQQIGEHRGVWHYTIGQRRGLGLPDATPWYVVGLAGSGNRVIVGKELDLLRHECRLHALVWNGEPPRLPWRGLVQMRSRHRPAWAALRQVAPDCWQLVFEQAQRAITPGQFAVFYAGNRVVGSAIISPQVAQSSPLIEDEVPRCNA
jgi:tRNA-specific 2-thiouridylase